jgi:hypothetical protein
MSFENIYNQIDQFLFNPYLSNEQDIIDYLKSKNKNVAHPFDQYMIACINNQISKVLKKTDPEFYKMNMSVQKQINDWEKKTPYTYLSTYSVHKINSESVTIPLNIDKPFIISLSDKTNGTFFDLLSYVCNNDNLHKIDYSNKQSNNIIHSGDKITSNILSHSFKAVSSILNNLQFIIGVNGYNSTSLYKYTTQKPVVLLVDHENKKLFTVPLDLDNLTTTQTTTKLLISCKIIYKNNSIYLKSFILKKEVINHANSNLINIIKKINSDINVLHEKYEDNFNGDMDNEIIDVIVDDVIMDDHIAHNNITNSNTIQFSDSGIFCDIINSNNILFGGGFGALKIPTYPKFPIIFGEIRDNPLILLGLSSNINMSENKINNSHVIVHLTNNDWELCNSDITFNQGNCIFIFHFTDKEFTDFSQNKLNCLEIIGPRSYVIYENKNKYYFYSGIIYAGFQIQKRGSEIVDFDEKIKIWLNSPLQYPVISLKNEFYIYGDISNNIEKYTFDDLINYDNDKLKSSIINNKNITDNLINILIQIEIIYDLDKYKNISSKFIEVFKLIKITELSKIESNINIENNNEQKLQLITNYNNYLITFNSNYSTILNKLDSIILENKNENENENENENKNKNKKKKIFNCKIKIENEYDI